MFDTANYLSFSEKLNDEIGINNTNIHTFAQISAIQQHKDRKKGGKGEFPPSCLLFKNIFEFLIIMNFYY